MQQLLNKIYKKYYIYLNKQSTFHDLIHKYIILKNQFLSLFQNQLFLFQHSIIEMLITVYTVSQQILTLRVSISLAGSSNNTKPPSSYSSTTARFWCTSTYSLLYVELNGRAGWPIYWVKNWGSVITVFPVSQLPINKIYKSNGLPFE